MSFILTDEQYREYQAYKKTGFTPEQIHILLNDPDDVPKPMIDDSVPTADEFWEEK